MQKFSSNKSTFKSERGDNFKPTKENSRKWKIYRTTWRKCWENIPVHPLRWRKKKPYFLPMHAYCGMCKMWQTPDNYEMSYLQNGNNRKTKSDYIIKKKVLLKKNWIHCARECTPVQPGRHTVQKFLKSSKNENINIASRHDKYLRWRWRNSENRKTQKCQHLKCQNNPTTKKNKTFEITTTRKKIKTFEITRKLP